MSCSNQGCMSRECLDWSSILHSVSCPYHLCATTSWHLVSLYWEGKVLWATQVTMLAGRVPFYFWCLTQSETLHFLKNTWVYTELMSCLSRVAFETRNMGHGVMSHNRTPRNLTHLPSHVHHWFFTMGVIQTFHYSCLASFFYFLSNPE